MLPHAGSLLAPHQGAKHDAHGELASNCEIALGWQINIVNVAHRLCASPLHTGGFYRGNETVV